MSHCCLLRPILSLVSTAFVLLALAACASHGGTTSGRPGLQVEPMAARDAVLPSPDATRLLLDPVLIDGNTTRSAELAANLRQVLIEECGATFAVVQRAGPDVLRLRLTLICAVDDLDDATLLAEVSRSTDVAPLLRVEEPVLSARDAGRDLDAPRWGDDERAFVAFARALRAELETLLGTRRAANDR